MRVRAWVVLAVAAVSVVFPASHASASCATPPAIEESLQSADLVFVGTVVELNNRNRWATFTVQEVWRGEVLVRTEVRGGPPGGQATSVDRTFEIDEQYLVFATKGERHWEDNACSATRPYEPSLERFRPANARTVGTTIPASAADEGVKSGTVVFAAVMLVVVVGGSLVVRRWGRNRNRHDPAEADAQLRHHQPYRPREDDAVGPHPRAVRGRRPA